MILHYGGKYDGNENSLPHKDHHPNAVPFREADDMRKMSLIANVGCILIMLLLVIPFLLLGMKYIHDNAIWMVVGGILGGLSLLPHELLHAICYKKDVYLYHDFAQGQIACRLSLQNDGDMIHVVIEEKEKKDAGT
jgi:hypothetical protein